MGVVVVAAAVVIVVDVTGRHVLGTECFLYDFVYLRKCIYRRFDMFKIQFLLTRLLNVLALNNMYNKGSIICIYTTSVRFL